MDDISNSQNFDDILDLDLPFKKNDSAKNTFSFKFVERLEVIASPTVRCMMSNLQPWLLTLLLILTGCTDQQEIGRASCRERVFLTV